MKSLARNDIMPKRERPDSLSGRSLLGRMRRGAYSAAVTGAMPKSIQPVSIITGGQVSLSAGQSALVVQWEYRVAVFGLCVEVVTDV